MVTPARRRTPNEFGEAFMKVCRVLPAKHIRQSSQYATVSLENLIANCKQKLKKEKSYLVRSVCNELSRPPP